MAQPRWDEQEVALLLDAYLRIEAGSSQKTAAEELSDTLRLRAVNRGFDIDDQFRNVNGMIMQLSNMQFVMTDGKRGLYGASSLIREVVQKRKADPQWFDQLLREAKASVTSSDIQRKSASTSQSENLSVKASALQKEELCVSEVQSHEDRFYEWLASRVSPAQLSVMYQAFHGLDQALIQSGRIGAPVLNNTDISQVRLISDQVKTDWGLRKVFKRENTSLLEKALDFFILYLEANSHTTPSTVVPPSPNPPVSSDKLVKITEEYNLRYKDERNSGGSFWIVMPFRNDKYLNTCREHGVVFHMKATGSPFHGQLSWYTNDTWQEVFAVKPSVNPPPTPNPPAFEGGNPPDAATQDGLVEIVKRYGFRYEDNRSKGGAFWIAMPRYNNRFKQESAHKFNGPKGTGFLYCREGYSIEALLHGGGQESGMRSGTENTAGIVGMAAALSEHILSMTAENERLEALRNRLIHGLEGADFIINGSKSHIPGSLSLSFAHVEDEVLLHRLDLMGIAVATGSACNSKDTVLSHVIQAIQVPSQYANGTIRITLGMDNNEEQVDQIAHSLKRLLLQFSNLS